MKPNVLLIVADQFRGDCLGCDGNPEIKTPHYDALAARGMRFSNAFTPCPICVPARATMITGKYPHNCTGTKNNCGTIHPGIPKLPELLAENGYRTYSSGKLHYLPYKGPGEERTLHGFEEAKLAESGRIISKYDKSGKTAGLEDYFDYLKTVGWEGYTRAHGIGNNDIHPAASPLPGEHTVDGWVATEAINFLDQHHETSPEQPFFLKASFPKPHAPFDPPRPYDAMYSPRELTAPHKSLDDLPRSPGKLIEQKQHGWDYLSPQAQQVIKSHYYGLISFQDQQVGRLIKHLENIGALENTYIIFVGDHGEQLGDFGYYFKTCMYEGSIRVPFLISGPGIQPNASDELVGLEDLTPTIADLLSIPLPAPVDGTSLTQVLHGGNENIRDAYYAYCLESPHQTYMVRTKSHKYIYNELGGTEELYDLKTDPGELSNRIQDPAMQSIHQQLRSAFITWARKHADPVLLPNHELAQTPLPTEPVAFDANVMGWRHY